MNMILLALYPFLFLFIIEYLATVLGSIVSFIYLVMFWIWYRKGGVEEVKDKKEDKKKKFRILGFQIAVPIIILIFLILLVFLILLIIIGLFFFSTTSSMG